MIDAEKTKLSPEDTLVLLEDAMLEDLDRQIDEEGCGAFMCAYFYQGEETKQE